jgi:hypothetical protein
MSNNNTGTGGNLGTAMLDIATTGAGVSANFPPLATPAKITEMMQRENDDLRLRNQELRAREQIAKEANDAMRALCAELRDAMEPFAAYAKLHGPAILIGRNGAYLDVSHWTNAGTALAKTPDTMGEEIGRLRQQRDMMAKVADSEKAERIALRQQLAERDAEVARLKGEVASWPGLYKGMEKERDALRARVSELTESLEHSKQWYACRVERLTEWVRKQDQAKLLPEQIVHDFFAIKANGSLMEERFSYASQLNLERFRAEQAEARKERLVAAGNVLREWVADNFDCVGAKADVRAWDAALADNGGATAANVSTPAPQTKIIGPAKGTPTAVRFLDDASPTETGAWGFKATDDTVFPAPLAQVQDGKVEIYGTAEAITAAFKDCPEQQWVLTLLLEILRLREKLGTPHPDSARLQKLWSFVNDDYGWAVTLAWCPQHDYLVIRDGNGNILAQVEGDLTEPDTQDEEGRTLRAAIDAMQAAKEGAS